MYSYLIIWGPATVRQMKSVCYDKEITSALNWSFNQWCAARWIMWRCRSVFGRIYPTDVGIDWLHSSWDGLFHPWFIFSCWLWSICLTSLYWREASREPRADFKNVDFEMPKSSNQPSGSRCWLVAPWCSALICAFVCFTEGQMRQTGHSHSVTLTRQRATEKGGFLTFWREKTAAVGESCKTDPDIRQVVDKQWS